MRENALVVPKSGLRRRKIPGCANMMSKSTHSVQGPSLDWVVFQQPATCKALCSPPTWWVASSRCSTPRPRCASTRSPESLRVFPPCPPCTPKHPGSSLQMLAIARAMAALCASIRCVLTHLSGTAEKLPASERRPPGARASGAEFEEKTERASANIALSAIFIVVNRRSRSCPCRCRQRSFSW